MVERGRTSRIRLTNAGENDGENDGASAGVPIAVDIDPAAGGRIAQITIAGNELLIDRDGHAAPTAWGSYPMVPWAGRIRRGRFTFAGIEHRLPINFGDHAIHGVGFEMPWAVTFIDARRAVLRLDLPHDERWPFGGRVDQEISVGPSHVLMTMEVTATIGAFPVSFGWHPWFRKPDRIEFHPRSMYQRDADGIAVAELVAVPDGPWDDCFVNDTAVRIHRDSTTFRLTSDCTDWVVYDEPPHATCIEPQTGPPDAFTIAPRILEPGERHRAWYRIEAETDDPWSRRENREIADRTDSGPPEDLAHARPDERLPR